MADAWSTVVTRESEWDERSLNRALGLADYEANRCPACRNYDALVPLDEATRNVTWAEHGGRRVQVLQFRCIFCAAADTVQRDWRKDHDGDPDLKGQAKPADGRFFIPAPLP